MARYYYKQSLRADVPKSRSKIKKILKISGLIFLILAGGLFIYILFPIISWQIFFAGAYSQNINYPIPKTTIVGTSNFADLLEASNLLTGLDYTNAQNWFPDFKYKKGRPKVDSYDLSIPKLDIKGASVSTTDDNLAEHLVNYGGSSTPPDKGNSVIFGHSTLPQLFNPSDYKTIFANLYKLRVGDEVWTKISNVSYKYKIYSITVVDPKDTSVLQQNLNDSFLTLVTCTPPGTVWKRLIIKAKLDTI